MFNPIRAILMMQLEITLKMLNMSKHILEVFIGAQPQASKVTSSMLALVPAQAEPSQPAAASIAHIAHQR